MAENASRFVIIDGVQIEKTRARKLGYIDENDKLVSRKGKVAPVQVAAGEPSLVDEAPAGEVDPADADADVAPAADVPSVEEPRGRRARGSETARKG